MIYFLIFAIVIMTTYIAEKKKRACIYWVGALILIVFGGIRKVGVGTDTIIYAKPIFDMAKKAGTFSELSDKARSFNIEKSFELIMYLTSRVFNNIQGAFFVIQALVIVPLFFAIWKMKEKINIVFAVVLYLFIFYSSSFNIMRQSIAISFIMLGISIKEKKVQMLICFIVSVLFHKSALIVFLIYIFWQMCKKYQIRFGKTITTVLIVFFTMFYNLIFQWLGTVFSFFPKRYTSQLYLHKTVDVAWSYLVLWVLMFGFVMIDLIKKKERIKENLFYYTVSFLCVIGVYFSSVSTFVDRLFIYFEFIQLLIVSRKDFVCITTKNHIRVDLTKLCLGGCAIAYFLWTCIITNGINTAHYEVWWR